MAVDIFRSLLRHACEVLVFAALVVLQFRFGNLALQATAFNTMEDAAAFNQTFWMWAPPESTDSSSNSNNNYNSQSAKPSSPPSPYDHIVLQIRKDPSKASFLARNSIPVYLFPFQDPSAYYSKSPSPDMIHIESNGLYESSVFRQATEEERFYNPNAVWLTDVKASERIWCKRFTKKVLLAQEQRRERNMDITNATATSAATSSSRQLLPLQWPVFVVDFSDERTFQRCLNLEKAMGSDFVFYTKRSVVVDRYFNANNTNWVELGRKVLRHNNVNYAQMPLIVRTDIVNVTEQQLLQDYNNTKLQDPIERLWNRSVDVAHYWPSDGSTGIRQFQNALRDRVSQILEDELSTGSSYNIFCGITGTADVLGRRQPQVAYVQAMLDTKIVVVTQRDEWEDHFRLYEALISGAMVMTDQMITLSDLGLKNGTSIVEFHNAESLISLAKYYLSHEKERHSIAQQGRFIAMSRHRSWHRMEKLILGSIVTDCRHHSTTAAAVNSGSCPYTVHANEEANG
eukprot:scaffold1073_cov98-Cylindrotheca_fusiformis.AAC.5